VSFASSLFRAADLEAQVHDIGLPRASRPSADRFVVAGALYAHHELEGAVDRGGMVQVRPGDRVAEVDHVREDLNGSVAVSPIPDHQEPGTAD